MNNQIISTNSNQLVKPNNIQSSQSLEKFIKSVTVRNKGTAKEYNFRIVLFEKFVKEKYGINLDELIQKIKTTTLEYVPYDVLNDYCIFLQNNYNIASVTFRDRIITVKNFFEYNDIEISPQKFKFKVRYPKTIFRHKKQ